MQGKRKFLNEFLPLLSQLTRKFNLLERKEIECFGVTVPQCCVMEALYGKEKLSMTELSGEIGVAVSTMTRILNVMVREGLVKRGNGRKDRRVVYVSLTPKGDTLAVQLKKCAEKYITSIYSRIPENSQEKVISSLGILLGAMRQNPSCCRATAEENLL